MQSLTLIHAEFPLFQSMMKQEPKKTFFFANAIFAFPQKAWETLRGRLFPLKLEKEIAISLKIQTENKKRLLEKALLSAEYHKISGAVHKLWKSMPKEQKHEFLIETAWWGLQVEKKEAFQRLFALISIEDMKITLAEADQMVQKMAKLAPYIEPLDTDRAGPSKNENPLLHFAFKMLDTAAITLRLMHSGKAPDSYFEGAYLLEIFYKLILIPLSICIWVFKLCSWPVAIAATGAGIAGTLLFSKFAKKPLMLPDFCRNLTEEAKKRIIKPCQGRDKETILLAESLLSGADARPLLVGDSRTGKTTIGENLACWIASGKLKKLCGKTVILVNTASLIAQEGADYKVKTNLQKLIDTTQGRDDIIVFFDDLHDALKKEGLLASQFNHYRPKYCFGATTIEGEKKIDQEESLAKRFGKRIAVQSTSEAKTCEILKQEAEDTADMAFTDEAFKEIFNGTNGLKVPQPASSKDSLAWIKTSIRKSHEQKLTGNLDDLALKANAARQDFPKDRLKEFLLSNQWDKYQQNVQLADENLNKAKHALADSQAKLARYAQVKSWDKLLLAQLAELSRSLALKLESNSQERLKQFSYLALYVKTQLESWLIQNKSIPISVDAARIKEFLKDALPKST